MVGFDKRNTQGVGTCRQPPAITRGFLVVSSFLCLSQKESDADEL